jgi:hypothetical protein
MDNLSGYRLSTIDVGYATVDDYLLSTKRELPALDTHFVGRIPDNLDELIAEFDLPFFR